MKNGIIINGIEYKAVSVSNPIGGIDNCGKCDLRKICERKNVQYPCQLFEKSRHLVYFRLNPPSIPAQLCWMAGILIPNSRACRGLCRRMTGALVYSVVWRWKAREFDLFLSFFRISSDFCEMDLNWFSAHFRGFAPFQSPNFNKKFHQNWWTV